MIQKADGNAGEPGADSARIAPPCASPPSLAVRPRVAARSAMRGAAWWTTTAAEGGSETLIPTGQCGPRGRRYRFKQFMLNLLWIL